MIVIGRGSSIHIKIKYYWICKIYPKPSFQQLLMNSLEFYVVPIRRFLSLNKYIMLDLFGRRSVEQTTSMIDHVLEKSSAILYDHYLLGKLPKHSTQQNVLVVKQIMDTQAYLPQNSRPVTKDSQPQRIPKDSLAAKSLHVKRIPNSTAKISPTPLTNQKLPIRHRFFHQAPKHAESKRNHHKSVIIVGSPLVELTITEPSQEEIDRREIEDQMRRKKYEQSSRAQSIKQQKNRQKNEKKEHIEKITKEYEDLEKKQMRYTYDFDGSILNCTPLNSKTPILSKSLCQQVRVKFGYQQKQKKQTLKVKDRKEQKSNRTNSSTKSEMFQSVAFNSMHASKLSRALRGNSLGSDFIRNETYNNDNKRQLSHVNIIEMTDGAVLTQLDAQVVITSDRRQPVTLKQFTQRTAKNRYKSFLQSNPQEFGDFGALYSPDDGKDSFATTTKLPSSMSGRTKKYTFRDSMNRVMKPMTAEPFRRRSQLSRPQTTSQTLGRVIANQSLMEALFQ